MASLLGPLAQYTWKYLLLSYLITIGGVVMHYAKKCMRSEADWDTYWNNNKKQSAISIVAATGSYVAILLSDPGASIITFAAIGYTVDSALNKAPASRKAAKPA
jgi:hypothetical protein